MGVSMVLLLAHNDWGGGHMDWGGGWWAVMGIGMLAFWVLVILGIVWVVRELTGRNERRGRENDAIALLDRRLAAGEISSEEYRERRAVLEDASHPPSDR